MTDPRPADSAAPPTAGAPVLPAADLWPAAAELAPLLRETIARWQALRTGAATWPQLERAAAADLPGWRGLAARIQLINAFQWSEEDRSRDAAADDATLAGVKRSIDASNARRVRAVEELDAQLVGGLEAAGLLDAAAPPHSESPGSIVDRLSVLALKTHHARDAARLALVDEQWLDLLACLDRLGADVTAGRVRVKLYRQVKLYGGGAPAARADENVI